MKAVFIILGAGMFAVVLSIGVIKTLELIRANVGANNEGDKS